MKEPECQPALQVAEQVLEQWHIDYKSAGAFNHMDHKTVCALWAQVEPRIMAAIAKRAPADAMRKALITAVEAEEAFLRRKVPNDVLRLLPAPRRGDVVKIGGPAKGGAGAVVAATSPAKLNVDRQGRVSGGESSAAPMPAEEDVEIGWATSETAGEVMRLKSELVSVLWLAHDLLPAPPVKVIGVRSTQGPQSKKTFAKT